LQVGHYALGCTPFNSTRPRLAGLSFRLRKGSASTNHHLIKQLWSPKKRLK
jgi:hypothetical protein